MPSDYYVTFFMQGQEKPTFFYRNDAVDGMRQSVSCQSKKRKRFDNRVILLKDTQNAVVFYEQNYRKRGCTIEGWQKRGGQWELSREIQEHV